MKGSEIELGVFIHHTGVIHRFYIEDHDYADNGTLSEKAIRLLYLAKYDLLPDSNRGRYSRWITSGLKF